MGFFKKIGRFFKKLWNKIRRILARLLVVIAIILVIISICVGVGLFTMPALASAIGLTGAAATAVGGLTATSLAVLATTTLFVAHVVDSKEASRMTSSATKKLGKAISGVTGVMVAVPTSAFAGMVKGVLATAVSTGIIPAAIGAYLTFTLLLKKKKKKKERKEDSNTGSLKPSTSSDAGIEGPGDNQIGGKDGTSNS